MEMAMNYLSFSFLFTSLEITVRSDCFHIIVDSCLVTNMRLQTLAIITRTSLDASIRLTSFEVDFPCFVVLNLTSTFFLMGI